MSTVVPIVQVLFVTVLLLVTAFSAAVFDVHKGYTLTWISFAWTTIFVVLRVFNRRHDSRSWRITNLSSEFISVILWATTTGLLAKDSAWLSDPVNGPDFAHFQRRGRWEYTAFGKCGLYTTYAAAVLAGLTLWVLSEI